MRAHLKRLISHKWNIVSVSVMLGITDHVVLNLFALPFDGLLIQVAMLSIPSSGLYKRQRQISLFDTKFSLSIRLLVICMADKTIPLEANLFSWNCYTLSSLKTN